MKIDCLPLGAYLTNCYVLRKNENAKDCLLIDTGLQTGNLIEFLTQNKLNPIALILTHGHPDHTGAIPDLKKSFPKIKVYIHKLDAKLLTTPPASLLAMAGIPVRSIVPPNVLVDEPQTIELVEIKLQVLHTPGHTPGGICLYAKEHAAAFVGDTLFEGSIGRTDLGGDMNQLITSITKKLLPLPGETIVYPGHGTQTTIAREKKYNPFLQQQLP